MGIPTSIGTNIIIDNNVSISRVNRQKYRTDNGIIAESDQLAVEEPLQVSLYFQDDKFPEEWTMTMRSPGNDEDLIIGMLLTQQIITSVSDVISLDREDDDVSYADNHWVATLAGNRPESLSLKQRSLMSHSSCGICGLTSIKALQLCDFIELDQSPLWISPSDILDLPNKLSMHQTLFFETGAVHSAGYFHNNQLIAIAEDIGRHNAVDKVVGHINRYDLWRPKGVLVLSGRVSFELMQKAALANIAVVIAVGAPSRLAVDIARQFDMTLIGFTKKSQFNIYHGAWRLQAQHSQNNEYAL
ncbi:formate dehydrogenase accessory sulfurtransferase FdhD [Vibrio sp.]|nr:formate dehydrogenase accessory sulfurtransferase FdhD [Vibrio sp.]